MLLVDSHCHLIFSHFNKVFPEEKAFEEKYNVSSIVRRSAEASVKYMLAIGTELSDVEELQSIVDQYDNIFRTIGIHPLEAKKHCELYSSEYIHRIIKENCAMQKTVGVGEIGLDFHYESESEKQQKELFHLQLNLAKDIDLPVVIHSREAHEDIINALRDYSGINGVIHCFSGEMAFARKALDLGFFMSISGVVTYKKSYELQETIKYIPIDRLLIETDAPFLSPVPFRGKINEPAFIKYTVEKIAELLEMSVEQIAEQTTKNFFTLFNKAEPNRQ